MYEELVVQHCSLLEEREKQKAEEVRRKVMQEKASRDKQLQEEKHRRRKETKDQHNHEVELVNRL